MYSGDMKAQDWVTLAAGLGSQMLSLEDRLYHLYKKWYAFTYGKTNDQIATALGTTEDVVVSLTALMTAFSDSYQFWHNAVVTQRDREADLSPFLNI